MFPTVAFLSLCVVLGSSVFQQKFQENLHLLLEEENLRVARLVAHVLGPGETSSEFLRPISRLVDARVTRVLPDGRVAADSASQPEAMDNHSDRPEILAASKDGWGQSIRKSATLKSSMIYTAVRIEDAQGKSSGYVRVARSLERLDELTAGFRRITWVAAVVVILMGLLACYFFLEMRISREERILERLKGEENK